MLDLGKSLGTHEGLECYGDDKNDKIVYYLPNEIKFARSNDKADYFLRVFREGETTSGGETGIRDSLGSLFEVGVICDVNEDRKKKAKSAVKSANGITDEIDFRPPTWEDGTVDLVILDAQKSEGEASKSEFVKTIVGSKKPTLSGNLSCLFHSSLNRKGTELATAALKGDSDSLIGVLYDLKYKAVRPAVDMRITANLDRCQETAQHNLDIGFQMYYYVDLSLAAQMEWLTQKMEENGDIKVEYFTDLETPELKKAADEILKEFKDAVLKELFEPFPDMDSKTPVTTDPQKASTDNYIKQGVDIAKLTEEAKKKKQESEKKGNKDAGKGGEAQSGTENQPATPEDGEEKKPDEKPEDQQWAEKFQVGIAYRMKDHKITMNKTLVVDYRERTTTVRTFNPQSHVAFMVNQEEKKEPFEDHCKELQFGRDYQTEQLDIQLDYDFGDNDDLSYVDVCIWKKKDGIDETIVDGFAIPSSAKALAQFKFSKNDKAPRQINWAPDSVENIGYYYQFCFVYKADVPNRYSPDRVLTQPFFSKSEDLIIQPDTYMFYRKYPIRVSDVAFEDISGVDLTLTVNPEAEKPYQKNITLDKGHNADKLIVRGCDKTDIPVKLEKTFRFADHSKPITTGPEFQTDDEIVICNPIAEKSFTFRLSGGGEGIGDLLVIPSVTSTEYGTELDTESFSLDPKKTSQKGKIRIFGPTDVVSYKVQVYASNKWSDLCEGEISASSKDPIDIDLSLIGKKKYTLKWIGKSPEECGLQYVSVIIKNGDGEVVQVANYKGAAVPEPIEFAVADGTELMLSVERKPVGQLPEPAQVSMITSDVIEIKP